MKIISVSDSHGKHERLTIPPCDLFIHAGDFTHCEPAQVSDILHFNAWLGKIPARQKIVIAGNHDRLFEGMYARYAQSIITNAIYLRDSGTIISDEKGKDWSVWGSPYTPYYRNWSFNVQGEGIKRHWDMIPENTDILVTHGPPRGILDKARGEHLGCPYLWDRVVQLKPKLHVFGHIHSGYGKAENRFINAAVCDDTNQLIHPPIAHCT